MTQGTIVPPGGLERIFPPGGKKSGQKKDPHTRGAWWVCGGGAN
jgi:hypothetical protein